MLEEMAGIDSTEQGERVYVKGRIWSFDATRFLA